MLYQQFYSQVEQAPDATAVFDGLTYSYGELNHKIVGLANALASRGVMPDSVVALAVPNSVEFVIACFAVFKLGAAVVPLNVGYTDEEIATYVSKSSACFLLVDDVQYERLHSLPNILVAKVVALMSAPHLRCHPKEGIEPSSTALMLFSSGSTGSSKKVSRSYQNLMAEWNSARVTMEIGPADVILCTVPMFHAHGFNNCILSALLNGAELVIARGEFNPRTALRLMLERKVSIYPSAPFMLKMLAAMRMRQKPSSEILRLVFSAGAPLEASIAKSFKTAFGVRPCQLYGSTETGAVAINYDGSGPSVSVGRPLHDTIIEIIDEAGCSLPYREAGEVAIVSKAAATAYDGQPELSAEVFTEGRYMTGDLGFFDAEGYLHITGRKKLMINVAGLKVDPLDVESSIRKLPGVEEVVVLGKPDGDYGEMVKAVIVSREPLDKSAIISACRQDLAEYKLPKIIEFRSEIPRSPLGKILRKYL